MKEVSNTTLAILLIIGIVVAFGGAFLNLNRLDKLPAITGFDTASTLNVTVTEYKAITVTGSIDFGSGYVTSGTGAVLDSGDTSSGNGSWSWAAQYFTIENQGNAALSVTANSSQNASDWIGAGATVLLNGSEPGSDNGCSGNVAGDLDAGQFHMNTSDVATICSSLASGNSADTVLAYARIIVPSDVAGSATEKWTNITFFAS